MNPGWECPDPKNPKAARCPFREDRICSIADLEKATKMGRQQTIRLDLSIPSYGSCYHRFEPKSVEKKKLIDVKVGWPPKPVDAPLFTPYHLPNDDPEKCYIPGYAGFVPRIMVQPGTFGRASHNALNEFTDSLLPVKQDITKCDDSGPINPRCNNMKLGVREVAEERACHTGCFLDRPAMCM